MTGIEEENTKEENTQTNHKEVEKENEQEQEREEEGVKDKQKEKEKEQDQEKEKEKEEEKEVEVVYPPRSNFNEDGTPKHPLQYTYCLWFNRRVQGARTQENYEKNIKKVGTFSTVEDFWDYYSHLIRPNDLPNTSDYHLFKDGIKPMWEDDANKSGGKWIVRLRKGMASRYWEDLILAVLGEQFEVGGEICGAVVSIRYQEDIISLWNRTATDSETKMKILETMKKVLAIDGASARIEYKNHDASIRDNSSFRNTEAVLLYGRREGGRERDGLRDRGDRGDRGDRDRDRDRDREGREFGREGREYRGEYREYREGRENRESRESRDNREGRDISPTFRDKRMADRGDRDRGERKFSLNDNKIDKMGDRRPFPKKIRGAPIQQPK